MSLYSKFKYEMCKFRKERIQNSLSLANISPEDFAYTYFNEAGYTALVRGDVMYLTQYVDQSIR